MLALINQAGDELARDATWQALIEEGNFVTTATQIQTGAIPSDLSFFIPDTFFNRSTQRKVSGPLSPQQWQAIQAMPALNTVYLMFRERQGAFIMAPIPPAGQSIYYEYVSKNWVKAALGSSASAFANDTDTSLISEALLTESLIWRFQQAKGLDYSQNFDTFERSKERRIGRDKPSGALTINARGVDYNRVNIPDGNYSGY